MSGYQFDGKRVWITGASSGIGRALAREFAQRNARVGLSARSEDDLKALSGELDTDSLVLPLDVTDADRNKAVCHEIENEWGGLDLVVLNAGTCEYLDAEQFDAEMFKRVFEVNVLGMVRGIEACLPLLKQSSDPYLVGMSSASAYLSLPRAEVYGASKTSVKYIMESLMYDLEPMDVSVSVICPGFVKTPLTEQNDFPMPFLIEPETAAGTIADRIESRTPEIHFPGRLTWLMKGLSLLPGWLLRPIIRRFVKQS